MNHPFSGSKWVEVNIDAVEHNYLQIRQFVPPHVKILGVVKADAYGHGAVEVSRILEHSGVDMLGVTTVEEGLELRRNNIYAPILVFGPFLPEDLETICHEELSVTVANREAMHWLKNIVEGTEQSIKVHLKVETGMGRLGFWPEDVVEAAREIREVPGLVLEGVYSHFAAAMWKDKTYTRQQFQSFKKVLEDLDKAGITGLIRHIANSAALLDLPEMHLDMVRTGNLLYGQYSSPRQEGKLALKNTWLLKTKVMDLRDLPAGHSVGYGRTYKTKNRARIAVLPIGFNDGFQVDPQFKSANLKELLKNILKPILSYLDHPRLRTAVSFARGKGKIVGKVGMQLTMVDVTGIPEITRGDIAEVPARRTMISAKVPRVYFYRCQVISVRKSGEVLVGQGFAAK